MRENKVRITINSDAHHPDSLIAGFPEVAEMLLAAGYRELWQWNGNGFSPCGFNSNGVLKG